MAPETLIHPPSRRSDVFSLGVVFLLLLTGKQATIKGLTLREWVMEALGPSASQMVGRGAGSSRRLPPSAFGGIFSASGVVPLRLASFPPWAACGKEAWPLPVFNTFLAYALACTCQSPDDRPPLAEVMAVMGKLAGYVPKKPAPCCRCSA